MPEALLTPCNPDRLLTSKAVRQRLDVSTRTFERWKASGRFPEPDCTIGRLDRWLETTVQGFIDSVCAKP